MEHINSKTYFDITGFCESDGFVRNSNTTSGKPFGKVTLKTESRYFKQDRNEYASINSKFTFSTLDKHLVDQISKLRKGDLISIQGEIIAPENKDLTFVPSKIVRFFKMGNFNVNG